MRRRGPLMLAVIIAICTTLTPSLMTDRSVTLSPVEPTKVVDLQASSDRSRPPKPLSPTAGPTRSLAAGRSIASYRR